LPHFPAFSASRYHASNARFISLSANRVVIDHVAALEIGEGQVLAIVRFQPQMLKGIGAGIKRRSQIVHALHEIFIFRHG
jgi:hypothetical protein